MLSLLIVTNCIRGTHLPMTDSMLKNSNLFFPEAKDRVPKRGIMPAADHVGHFCCVVFVHEVIPIFFIVKL